MSSTKTCPQCGKPLPDASAIGGACPSCMLAGGLPTSDQPGMTRFASEEADSASNRTSDGAMNGSWEAPSAQELDALFPQLDIIERCGKGGMGAVYRAKQSMLGREVAVKVLSPRISQDVKFEERFAREARALAQLTHPGIVTVYDFGRQNEMCYLVMEFVDGVNLREAIQTQSISPDQALEIVAQVCDALQYAHGSGVVHRDIKPENILLDRKGQVKLADFGLAKLVGSGKEDIHLTATNQVMGTLHYMAPEQLERPLEVDHRADIYSLGVVFYELLTGQLPLGRFKLPSETGRTGFNLDDVVLRTLERAPEDRYQRVSEFGDDISRVSSHGTGATPRPKPEQERVFSGKPVETGPRLVGSKSRRYFPGVLLSGSVLLLVSFGLLLHGLIIGEATLWIGLGIGISSVVQLAGAFRSEVALKKKQLAQPNMGVLLHGLAFVWIGALVSPGGFGTAFGWVGMGMLIAGGCIMAGAWVKPGRRVQVLHWRSPNITRLMMAGGFFLFGTVLLMIGVIAWEEVLIWIGFGLSVAGGSMTSSVWIHRSNSRNSLSE
ncbi:MAG: serine/threonine-protein kinase [Planctomycetota bacterium]